MTFKVGFTGTRVGTSDIQRRIFAIRLRELYQSGAEFHHGRCVGADEEISTIARTLGYHTVGHPGPPSPWQSKRCRDDEVRGVKPFLDRNYDIVRECTVLLAAPISLEPVLRSGTWTTIRYAIRQRRHTELIDSKGNRHIAQA